MCSNIRDDTRDISPCFEGTVGLSAELVSDSELELLMESESESNLCSCLLIDIGSSLPSATRVARRERA